MASGALGCFFIHHRYQPPTPDAAAIRKNATKPLTLRCRSGGGARKRRDTSSNGVMTTESGPGGCRRSTTPLGKAPDEKGAVAPERESPTARTTPDVDEPAASVPALTGPESSTSISASTGSSSIPSSVPDFFLGSPATVASGRLPPSIAASGT